MILYTMINFGAFNKCQALIKVDSIHILCLTLKVIVKALYYKECKSLKTCSLIHTTRTGNFPHETYQSVKKCLKTLLSLSETTASRTVIRKH